MPEIKLRPSQPPSDWQWLSICSMHHEYTETCGCCNAGRWVNEASDYQKLLHWLWGKSPRLWRKWANSEDAAGDRAHLEEIFPNLKGAHQTSTDSPADSPEFLLKQGYKRGFWNGWAIGFGAAVTLAVLIFHR